MRGKDEEMLLELSRVISYAHIMFLNSKTSEDAIDELLNIVKKHK